MKKTLTLSLFLLYLVAANAQPITFSKVFSNFPLNPENGWVLNEVQDGYILLSAADCLDNSGLTCCMISKINLIGDVAWSNIYPFRTTVSNLVVHNNKIFASGHTHGTGSQYVLYCLDSLGNVLWNREYGSPLVEDEFPRLTLWGDRLILGGAQDRNINNRRAPIMFFVVTDLEGNQLTEFSYGAENESTLVQKIVSDTKSNCIIGFEYCPDTCFLDLKGGVISFDTLTNINWVLDFPSSYSSWTCTPGQVNNNTLAVSWYVDNTTIPNHDLTPPTIFFADMAGNILDTIIFQNQTLKEIRNMEPVWEDGLITCGFEFINYLFQSGAPRSGWLTRINANREIVWERSYLDTTYNGKSFGLQHVIPTSDGGYLATGTISNTVTGVQESHNWLLKLDAMGCLTPGCGGINYITDTEESVFLTAPNIRVYPNPANNYVRVDFPQNFYPGSETVAILVSNEGKMVRQETITANSHLLHLVGVEAGVYYLIIRQKNAIISSKKIIVQR